jgi:uncharacterized protein DUF1559
MSICLRTLVLFGLALLPVVASAQQPKPEAIAPFLDGQTIAVGHLDMRKVDLQAALDFFAKDVPADLLPAAQRAEVVAKGTDVKDKLIKAGCSDVYVIVSLADLPEGKPLVVLALARDARPEAVVEVLSALGPAPEAEPIHGSLVLASPQTRERLKTLKAIPRPDLIQGLQSAGDSAIQFVASPSDETRRVMRESLPALPPELGGLSGAELADSFGWLAISANLPPRPSVTLTIKTRDAQAAQQLRSLAQKGLDLLVKNEAVQRQFPPIKGLAPLVLPKVQEDRLVLKIDEQEGNLTKIMDELVRPAVASARAASGRAQSANNLKQLMISMHVYHDIYKHFPAQTNRKDGKKLLSWRVHVLPYLEQDDLYKQFHLDEPWDSEHNKKLIEKMPSTFASPNAPADLAAKGMTTYLVPVGPKTVFEGEMGIELAKISDGTSNTIAIVEVAPEHAVVWTKPDDWNVDFSKPFAGLLGKPAGDKPKQPAGFNAAMCDGSVHFIASSIAWETMRRLLQKDDGEVVGDF